MVSVGSSHIGLFSCLQHVEVEVDCNKNPRKFTVYRKNIAEWIQDLFQDLDLLNSMHIYPEKQSQILPDGTSICYTTEPWMSTNLWGYWVSILKKIVPLIISDSTWRILPPQTMVVSLQYCLEYCTTPISPNCFPLEVSKGGLFLHMPYLCPAVSAMAGAPWATDKVDLNS